jgi:hypothetical protein
LFLQLPVPDEELAVGFAEADFVVLGVGSGSGVLDCDGSGDAEVLPPLKNTWRMPITRARTTSTTRARRSQ